MAEIRKYPVYSHLRSEPSSHVLRFRSGELVAAGRGLAFWFAPLDTAVAEVPMDDRELTFLIHGSTLDFQDVVVQGVVTWRVADPEVLAARLDFHLDLASGRYAAEPIEQVAGLLTQLAQQVALEWLAERPLRDVLAAGTGVVRERVAAGLFAERGLGEMGLEVVTVRVSSIRPSAEVEKALQTPVREGIQQDADEAVFQRRAVAVEKERAIAENELQNRIELARREEQLISQQGANERLQARERAEAESVRAAMAADSVRVGAEAEADSIRLIQGATAETEAQLMDVYRDLPAHVLMGLAAKEFAGKLEMIEHLNITPELLSPLLGDLMSAATRRLEG